MLKTPTIQLGRWSKLTPTPSSPPVHSRGFFPTSVKPASANASVTIAKAMPLTRRLTAPRTSGSSRPTSAMKASVGAIPHPHFVVATAVR